MKRLLRALRSKVAHFVEEARLLATETEIHQVKTAAYACLGAALLALVLAHGIIPRVLLVTPLLGLAAALVAALKHTVAFRRQRLEAGQCGHPFCHGVVQHSAHVPPEHVICPTCKRVWPELPGMEFHFTQRAATGRASLFM